MALIVGALRERAARAAAADQEAIRLREHLAERAIEEARLRSALAERDAQARAAASARLASLGEMAAGLAHELKQPLAIISLAAENAQAAAQTLGADAINRRLATIVRQVQRTSFLIEHLRRYARGPDMTDAPSPIRLEDPVAGALSLVGGTLREAEINIEVVLGDPSPTVLGNEIGLEQILVNLLSNARDAMAALPPSAPRRVLIQAAADPERGMVRLSVEDTGGGMAEPVLGRLFEPFFTTKGLEAGTGLGLSICKGLARAMGGDITARNGEQGAVFKVTLPAAQTARPPAIGLAPPAEACSRTEP
jgi:C4-dicarboxylate-specific signal transduction histidine kinase